MSLSSLSSSSPEQLIARSIVNYVREYIFPKLHEGETNSNAASMLRLELVRSILRPSDNKLSVVISSFLPQNIRECLRTDHSASIVASTLSLDLYLEAVHLLCSTVKVISKEQPEGIIRVNGQTKVHNICLIRNNFAAAALIFRLQPLRYLELYGEISMTYCCY
jgi:hypothetical protein